MSKHLTLAVLGALLFFLRYFGFPSATDVVIVQVFGLCIILIAFFVRRDARALRARKTVDEPPRNMPFRESTYIEERINTSEGVVHRETIIGNSDDTYGV